MAEIIINPNTTHKEKSPQTLAALSFLGLFLLSILIFFTKRALDPTLSLYRDLFYSSTPLPLSSSSSSSYYSSSLILAPPPGPADSHISSLESSPDSPPESADSGGDQEKKLSIPQSESEFFSAISEAGHSETVRKWAMPCDVYVGNWVKDEREDYPLYSPGSCPYVDEAFDCQSNGRRDSDYLKWRWKPHGCELPRFNATDFLVRLRGKRLMLVGDSMNRNQFESLLCLLREGLADKSRMYEVHGYKITKGRGFYIFKFEDYNCTVEFVRSHFLVKEGIRINAQGKSNPTLSIDRIDKSTARWKRADILVFNTGHWWTHGKTARGWKN